MARPLYARRRDARLRRDIRVLLARDAVARRELLELLADHTCPAFIVRDWCEGHGLSRQCATQARAAMWESGPEGRAP